MASLQSRLTRAGYDRLNSELEALKARRGELRDDIAETRAQGDLRENHAYHAAKDAQGMVEARISELEARLADAVILEEGETVDSVLLGIPVRVKTESGAERIYTIVSPEEMDDDDIEGAASEASPVGQALLGKKMGEIAEVEGPNGIVRFEVVHIGE